MSVVRPTSSLSSEVLAQPTAIRRPRVAICVPMYDHCRPQTMISLMALLERTRNDKQSIGIFPTIATNITCARNSLVIQALKSKATHIFWSDSDMEFPDGIVDQFLRHDKDVVFANYSTRRPPFRSISRLKNPDDWVKGGLQLAETAAHGAALIRMSVYEKLKFPWYVERYDERDVSESNPLGYTDQDEVFSERAAYEGYDLWCDVKMSQKIGHIGENIYRLEGYNAERQL